MAVGNIAYERILTVLHFRKFVEFCLVGAVQLAEVFGQLVNFVKRTRGLEHDAFIAFAVSACFLCQFSERLGDEVRNEQTQEIAEAGNGDDECQDEVRAAEYQYGNSCRNRAAENSQQSGKKRNIGKQPH